MAEWLKALAWKACILLKVSRVRIPFSPPQLIIIINFKDNINFFNNLAQKVAAYFFPPKEDVCKYTDQ